MNPSDLTIQIAQNTQPWTVPYSPEFVAGPSHIMGSHAVLHAAKSVGKLAAVFERLDHRGGNISPLEKQDVGCMAADLVTAALRLANLFGIDLAKVLCERTAEKNGVGFGEQLADMTHSQ